MPKGVHIFAALILLVLMQITPVLSQEDEPETSQSRYSLDGDEINIEVTEPDPESGNDQGYKHLTVIGNVILTYPGETKLWTLTSDFLYLTEVYTGEGSGRKVIKQEAVAEGNISISNGTITITLPGSLNVNLLERWLRCESADIHLQYPDGEIITNSLFVREIVLDGEVMIGADTAIRTIADINLAESGVLDNLPGAGESQNMFGNLSFDFSTIQIETTSTSLIIIDGEPVMLNCPNPTVITSDENILTIPSCRIGFDPPRLESDMGIELIMPGGSSVVADYITFEYPASGGLTIEFTGLCITDPDAPDRRVIINHPAGTFIADSILVKVNTDGTQSIVATGCPRVEIPIDSFLPSSGEESAVDDSSTEEELD